MSERPGFDFHRFIERMADIADVPAILREAEAACLRAEHAKESVYRRRLGEFMWYMRYGTQPGSATRWEFAEFRPVVVALVEAGQWKAEALARFESQIEGR